MDAKMTHTHFGQYLLSKIMESELPSLFPISDNTFFGVNVEQILEACKPQSVSFLPKTYIEFMQVFGKNAVPLFSHDSNISFDTLDYAKDIAIECLQDDKSPLVLPLDALIFQTCHVSRFQFFLTANQEDDPPVYLYFYDDPTQFQLIADRLSAYYFDQLAQKIKEAHYFRSLRRKR